MMRGAGLMLALVVLTIAVSGAVTASPSSVTLRAASSSAPSAWDRPALAANAQTIQLDEQHRNLKLDQNTDYVLTCSGAVQATWGLVVWGGHNVVLDGCDYVNSSASGAAQFKNQTGTLWLHDVHFAGARLTEGIDLQEPDATVVMRDVLVDEVHGSRSTNHADVVQSWSGPRRFLVDGFTGTTEYQGFFLMPNQNGGGGVESVWDFRHVDLHGVADAGHDPAALLYLGWVGADGHSSVDLHLGGVFLDEPSVQTVPAGQWADAVAGVPPGGRFVVASGSGAAGPDEPGSSSAASGAGVDPVPLAGEQ